MPVTVKPSSHGPSTWTGRKFRQASSPEALLAHTLTDEALSSSSSSSSSSSAGGGGSGGRGATRPARQLIQSSFAGLRREDRVYATKNGFVHACMEAYNEHHRLVIRPEDVWLAILTQLGSYINAHAEELRDVLLLSDGDDDDENDANDGDVEEEEEEEEENQENDGNDEPTSNGSGSGNGGGRIRSRGGGTSSRSTTGRRRQPPPPPPQRRRRRQQQQQHLHIEADLHAGGGLDHGRMAHAMTKLMQRRFRDPDLRDWVQPAFTTTTKADQAAAGVVLMGAMQRYFTYSWGTRCGIPAATLLGVESDWVRVRQRAERLARFGFGFGGGGGGGRRPSSYDSDSDNDESESESGNNEPGRWLRLLRPVLDGFVRCFRDPGSEAARAFWRAVCDEHVPNGSGATTYSGWITAFCFWDEAGRCLHGPAAGAPVRLTRSQLPIGFTRVPVTLLDGGLARPAEMIAGSVAMRASSARENGGGGDGGDDADDDLLRSSGRPVIDTIQPEIGWFMYTT